MEVLFNYHTHTYRCGHAGSFSDREYIEAARESGITTIGFSDHVPNIIYEYQDPQSRMHIRDIDEYLESIDKLREEYPDMVILSGFEAEYNPAKREFLTKLRDRVDYLILGQHFINNGFNSISRSNNPNYPIEYAKSVCEALDTGLFDMVAHPDIFMAQLKTLESEEDRELFLENAVIASRMICEKAKEMGIPIELNLGGLRKKDGYPDPTFWRIASEVGTKVIVGADAHNPIQLKTMKSDLNRVLDIIGNISLDYVDIDYNPVNARNNNAKFLLTEEDIVSYEDHLTNQLIDIIMSSDDIEKTYSEIVQAFEDKLKEETKDEMSPYYEETLLKRKELFNRIINRINEYISIEKKH